MINSRKERKNLNQNNFQIHAQKIIQYIKYFKGNFNEMNRIRGGP